MKNTVQRTQVCNTVRYCIDVRREDQECKRDARPLALSLELRRTSASSLNFVSN